MELLRADKVPGSLRHGHEGPSALRYNYQIISSPVPRFLVEGGPDGRRDGIGRG